MSNFSEVLKRLIIENNLTIISLEKAVNIYNTQLSSYINGTYQPSLNNAIKLADYFSCSLDYLNGLDNEKLKHPIVREASHQKFIENCTYLIKLHKTNENRVAIQLEFSRQSFLRWRKFGIFPELSIIIKLSKYFDVPIEYLVGRIDL